MKQNDKLSSEEIYAILEAVDSNDEQDLDNLMNDSDTEFVDKKATENSERDIPKAVTHEKDDSNVGNFVLTTRPIEAVVQVAKPDSESGNDGDNVPLSNLVANKATILRSQH